MFSFAEDVIRRQMVDGGMDVPKTVRDRLAAASEKPADIVTWLNDVFQEFEKVDPDLLESRTQFFDVFSRKLQSAFPEELGLFDRSLEAASYSPKNPQTEKKKTIQSIYVLFLLHKGNQVATADKAYRLFVPRTSAEKSGGLTRASFEQMCERANSTVSSVESFTTEIVLLLQHDIAKLGIVEKAIHENAQSHGTNLTTDHDAALAYLVDTPELRAQFLPLLNKQSPDVQERIKRIIKGGVSTNVGQLAQGLEAGPEQLQALLSESIFQTSEEFTQWLLENLVDMAGVVPTADGSSVVMNERTWLNWQLVASAFDALRAGKSPEEAWLAMLESFMESMGMKAEYTKLYSKKPKVAVAAVRLALARKVANKQQMEVLLDAVHKHGEFVQHLGKVSTENNAVRYYYLPQVLAGLTGPTLGLSLDEALGIVETYVLKKVDESAALSGEAGVVHTVQLKEVSTKIDELGRKHGEYLRSLRKHDTWFSALMRKFWLNRYLGSLSPKIVSSSELTFSNGK